MAHLRIPSRFWTVRYNGKAIPDRCNDLGEGANCQRFAYAILAGHGIKLPPFRSSDLWEDTQFTFVPQSLEPLDLILFNASNRAYGAHIAVYVGEETAVHLSKEKGYPEAWPLTRFGELARYRFCIGAKRALLPRNCPLREVDL